MMTRHLFRSLAAACVLQSAVSALYGYGGDQPPPPPAGVRAIPGNAKATISWNASSGATSYTVYWSASPGVTTASPTKTTTASTSHAITPLSNGGVVYVIVTATNQFGESGPSLEVSATPQASVTPAVPNGVRATGGNGQITVTWDPSLTAETYNIYYRATPGVNASNGTQVAGASSPRTISSLTNGTCYYIVVTGVNGSNESAASSEVCATPVAP